MVDEAHSLGALDECVKGVREHCGVARGDVDIWMGTLGKTLAGCGGFIAGTQALIDDLVHLAPGFLYSVWLATALAAAWLAALERLIASPERAALVHAGGSSLTKRVPPVSISARARGLQSSRSLAAVC